MNAFTILLMIFNLTTVFTHNQDALFNPEKRIAINEGGTSSSKTYSILQLLVDICQHRTRPLICSVVSESLPHLKLGCIRDFKQIMGEDFNIQRWNATENIYNFNSNVILEFFSADQPGKARGPRRDILFVNEANNVPKSIFDELDMRTHRFVFIDFNPVYEFWAHELKGKPEVEWIHSTYLDAMHVLRKSDVEKIEAKKDRDPNWWNVYGLGLIGNVEGLVHPLLLTDIDELPDGNPFYGLDFGYTNDPTTLIKSVIVGDEIFSDELIYQTGLNNQQIANQMKSLGVREGYDEIFADAAEPKSIDEIHLQGFNVKPAPKGPDSIAQGIQKINQYKQHWTKRSINSIKEQRNYRYIQDKDGKYTNKPIDNWNHAMDARRYGLIGKMNEPGTPGIYVIG